MPPRTEWLKRSETVNEIHQYRAKVIYLKYYKNLYFCFYLADLAESAVRKISAILLKVSYFLGCFWHIFVGKMSKKLEFL